MPVNVKFTSGTHGLNLKVAYFIGFLLKRSWHSLCCGEFVKNSIGGCLGTTLTTAKSKIYVDNQLIVELMLL